MKAFTNLYAQRLEVQREK